MRKINEIENKELRENLTKTAISALDLERYVDLAGYTVEFGYLYDFEGRGLETLFKIITGMQTYYVSIQRNTIAKLELNEPSFKNAVKNFLELHQ